MKYIAPVAAIIVLILLAVYVVQLWVYNPSGWPFALMGLLFAALGIWGTLYFIKLLRSWEGK
jgi:hypothetical protein